MVVVMSAWLEIDVAPAQGAQFPQAKASERGGDEHCRVLLVLDAPGVQLGVGQFALGRLVVASKRCDDRERVNFPGAEHAELPGAAHGLALDAERGIDRQTPATSGLSREAPPDPHPVGVVESREIASHDERGLVNLLGRGGCVLVDEHAPQFA